MDNKCEMESKTTPNHSYDKYYFCKKCRKILCNHCYLYHVEHKNFSFSFDDFISLVDKLKENITMKIAQETDSSEKINIFEDKINNSYPGKEISEMKKCINSAFNKVKGYNNNDENKNNFLSALLNINDCLNTIEKPDKQSFIIFVDNEIEFEKIYKAFSENNPINQFEKFFADCTLFYEEFKKKIKDEYNRFQFNFNKNTYNNINHENNNLLNLKSERYENKRKENIIKNEYFNSNYDIDSDENNIKNDKIKKKNDNVFPIINNNKKNKIIDENLYEKNNFIEPFLNLNENKILSSNNSKNDFDSKIENEIQIPIVKKQKINEEKNKEISKENKILNQLNDKSKEILNQNKILNQSKDSAKGISNQNSILNLGKEKRNDIIKQDSIFNQSKDKIEDIKNKNSILNKSKDREKEKEKEKEIQNQLKDKLKEKVLNEKINQPKDILNSKINDKISKEVKTQKTLEQYVDKKKNIQQENQIINHKQQNDYNIIFSYEHLNEDNHNFIFIYNNQTKQISCYQVYQENNNIKFPFLRSKGINIKNSYYITGGYEKNKQSNTCFQLSYKDDNIIIKEDSKMNFNRASHNIIYIPSKNRIVVSSGENNKECEYLDLNNKNNRRWIKFSKLNEYRGNASMFCINERYIYCIGGYNFFNQCMSQGYEVLDLDDKNLFWKFYHISDLLNICLMGIVNLDDKNIILVGGECNKKYLNNVYHVILEDNKSKISSVNERKNIIDKEIMFYNSQNFININNNQFIGFDCYANYIEYDNNAKIFKYDNIKY